MWARTISRSAAIALLALACLCACDAVAAGAGIRGTRRPAANATAGATRRPVAFAGAAATANAAQFAPTALTHATLHASFHPNRLGGRTTLHFGFSLSAPPGEVPPPMTEIQLRYPGSLGIPLSGVGLQTCSSRVLKASGPRACPPDSVMGYGVVLTGIVLGSTVIHETAPITVLRAPTKGSSIGLLFYAEGRTPVEQDIVFSGLLVPAPQPFGGQVNIGVPLVEPLPGAPDISVMHMHSTLGPKGLTYFEDASGYTLAYRPAGIPLPRRCPRHAFPFAAEFRFTDGTHAKAHTVVKCPRHRAPRARHGRHVRRRSAARGKRRARRS